MSVHGIPVQGGLPCGQNDRCQYQGGGGLYLRGVPGIPTHPGRNLGQGIHTPLWTDTHLWKHYLLPTSLAGGNNKFSRKLRIELKIGVCLEYFHTAFHVGSAEALMMFVLALMLKCEKESTSKQQNVSTQRDKLKSMFMVNVTVEYGTNIFCLHDSDLD